MVMQQKENALRLEGAVRAEKKISQVHYSTERTEMANIIEEILKAATSEDTSQETKDAIQMAFIRRFIKETDSGVTISYVQKKGEDASEVKIEGFSYRVEFGTCKLLADVCRNLGRGDKQAALRKVDDICEYAKKLINDAGETVRKPEMM